MSLKDVSITRVHVGSPGIIRDTAGGMVRYHAVTRSKDPEVWACDKWDVTLTYQGRTFTMSYSTGIGHRRTSRNDTRGYYRDHLTVKPFEPSQILDCLFSDASAANETFESWASDLGYDPDSRKALDTYLACQKNGIALRKLLGSDYATIEAEVRAEQ